jgi:hypothetical protein
MKKILLWAALLLALPAHAEWVHMGLTYSGWVQYIDPKTVKIDKDSRAIRRAWTLENNIDQPDTTAKGGPLEYRSPGSVSRLLVFDCEEEKFMIQQVVAFSKHMGVDQKGRGWKPDGSDWEYVAPNTTAERTLRYACSR